MAKYDLLSNQLRVRILHGDYVVRPLPAERQLAVEHGVSYMTARRALQHLVDEGLLKRAANGRVEVNRDHEQSTLLAPIAMLSPAYNSHDFDSWRRLIAQTVEAQGGRLRQELYTHWDDPIFTASMHAFSGVFLLPSSERMPQTLINRLAQAECPLVVLDDDLSTHGIPSLRQFSPFIVAPLLDHLRAQGCQRIDCLNVQPLHSVMEQYIEQWQAWTETKGNPGELINAPVAPYESALTQAYCVMQQRLTRNQFTADALFCLTAPAAIGAMRALHEAGIRPGHDVAVCTTNGEGEAEFQIPSLTAFEPGDITPHLAHCINWMLQSDKKWSGPIFMEPPTAHLQPRESSLLFAKVAH